jgi:lipopolysaccharide assembly outer membrane protein LptD (OstA)
MPKHAFLNISIASLLMTCCVLLGKPEAIAQSKNKIELLGAKDLKYDKQMGLDAQRLIGDVRFRHQGALMYCDSAYLYNATNSLDAFGNVRINQGDTLQLFSKILNYNGNTKLIKVREEVRLVDKEMTLTTDILDYDRVANVALFYEGGRINSKLNKNELTAVEGIYAADIEMFYFRDSVVLINPRYRMETDTLDYNNATEVSYFEGPTFIFSEENTIYCENGWYDTKHDIAQFNENAYLDNKKQVLSGDSLWYSRLDGLGRAFNNVSVVDTTDKYLIKGHVGLYNELNNSTMVTDRAQFIQYDQRDSLFLHADTLLALDDEVLGKKLFAYHGARFYRSDMQGAADSIYFAKSDSIIYMYKEPVLWSDALQITGDTMEILNGANGLERLLVYQNAMLVDKVDTAQYNQIKGRILTGYFKENELYKVLINGNGQSLYYALEEVKVPINDSLGVDSLGNDASIAEMPDSSRTERFRIMETVIGVNKAKCSNIAIYLENRKVQRIRFLVSPEGSFIPIQLFDTEESYMDGFNWQQPRRPKNKLDIFRKDEKQAVEVTEENLDFRN